MTNTENMGWKRNMKVAKISTIPFENEQKSKRAKK
jgi:hypothetical protein